MSSVAFMASIFFENNTFWIAFHILVWNFSGFQHYFSSTLVRIALVFRFFNRFYAIFFGLYAKFFWLDCQNCTLRVHKIVSLWSIFFEKKTSFSLCFTFWVETFQVSGKFSPARESERHWFLGYFYGTDANIFRTSRKFFWLVCHNCTLRAHGIVFMGSIFFEKNTFPIVFQILGGNFPGFWHSFSSTLTRTELISRFLIGFLPIISDFTQISIGWSVGTALYVSTGSFSWEASSLKRKTLFNLYFAFWIETFQVFGETFPAR